MSKNSIAQRIIDARKAKKWTQKDLANALNVNTKNVTRWERKHPTNPVFHIQ